MNIDSLQPSLVVREFKRVLTDKYKVWQWLCFVIQLSKDAKDTIVLSTNIFIHYITTLYVFFGVITNRALEYAQQENKSTIQPKYILQALESAGFDEMIPEIEEMLQRIVCEL